MKMPKNKLLRTLLYFIVVGGLLLVSSVIIMYLWNNLLSSFDILPITYLEAMGLNAVIYVFIYSISYGFLGVQSDLHFSKPSEEMLDQLSQMDKDELKRILKKTISEN